ncbi:hypothetical protein E4U19_005378 [Claviceps sp. Clav32 group G5]|nr:hypothetical protein E4U19_005378 [Claviceps sp. Clav32 group G5]KAG6047051.1 hypothetical protein E4U39_000776 [Claviceps sp. Clav50 group G5]
MTGTDGVRMCRKVQPALINATLVSPLLSQVQTLSMSPCLCHVGFPPTSKISGKHDWDIGCEYPSPVPVTTGEGALPGVSISETQEENKWPNGVFKDELRETYM